MAALYTRIITWLYYNPINFEKLCSGNNSFKEANVIIKSFVSIPKYYDDLHIYFKKFAGTYQYIYSMLFPKFFDDNDKFGIN